MNDRKRPFLIGASLLLVSVLAFAQHKAPQKQPVEKKAPVGRPVMVVTLGGTDRTGGDISKSDFDHMAPAGIRIKDPNGAFIEGFSFTYGERNLYEDSAGNPKPVTDYLTEYCMGDTLSPIISKTISSRTKPGDTAYFDDIHIRLSDGKPANGKSMKFVITR